MGNCRVCNTEVKPYQVYCPNCGLKHPLLDKEDLKNFAVFKKRFGLIFPIVSVIIILLFILFVVKIPVMQPVPYTVQQSSPEMVFKEKPLGCTEEPSRYVINFIEKQVFADVKKILQIKLNLENLENEQGTFQYTVKIIYKMSQKEQQKTSEVTLGPYENKTVYAQFEGVSSPDEVEYYFNILPHLRSVCKTETERTVIEKKEEVIKIRQEKTYKTVFRLILEKIN